MATNSPGNNVQKTISLSNEEYASITRRIEALGLKGLSHYFQLIARKDYTERPALILTESAFNPGVRPPEESIPAPARSRRAKRRK